MQNPPKSQFFVRDWALPYSRLRNLATPSVTAQYARMLCVESYTRLLQHKFSIQIYGNNRRIKKGQIIRTPHCYILVILVIYSCEGRRHKGMLEGEIFDYRLKMWIFLQLLLAECDNRSSW